MPYLWKSARKASNSYIMYFMKKGKLIFLFITASFICSANGWSQSNPPAWIGIPVGATKQGASKIMLLEYSNIVSQYDTKSEQWWVKFEANISKADKERLEVIFREMNEDQQLKQRVAFVNGPRPLKKIMPSAAQLNSWKNEKLYGVWIDGNKVKNAILYKFKNSEFAQVSISKFYGAAKYHQLYFYQVNLMTNNYYQKYYAQALKNSGMRMVFR